MQTQPSLPGLQDHICQNDYTCPQSRSLFLFFFCEPRIQNLKSRNQNPNPREPRTQNQHCHGITKEWYPGRVAGINANGTYSTDVYFCSRAAIWYDLHANRHYEHQRQRHSSIPLPSLPLPASPRLASPPSRFLLLLYFYFTVHLTKSA